MTLAHRLKTAHLRLILKTAETGKLQVAAAALGISQPAASRIIAAIETEAGTPLFLRSPKGMEATPVGTAFIRHAKVILAEFGNLDAEVQNMATGHIGEVRVGTVTGPAVGCLVPAILEIRKTSPKIELTVEVGPSTALARGLEEGRFDFVIARLPPDYDSRAFRILPARSEIVAVVARKSHPLARKPRIPLDEVAGFEWVIQERGSPIRVAVERAFHNAGVPTPSEVINSSSLLVVLSILEKSDAVAPLSQEVAGLLTSDSLGAQLANLDLAETIMVSPYFIIQNQGQRLTRAAERVLEAVQARL